MTNDRFERIINKVQNSIDSGVGDLIKGSLRSKTGTTAAALSRAEFADHSEEIRGLANNPEMMQETLVNSTQHFHSMAPNTGQAIHVATATAVNFLNSKLPQTRQPGPLAKKLEPSQAEIATYARYKQAIDKPLSILDHARAGMVSQEEIEAVKTVYPQLFQKIQASVIDKLTDHRGTIPYARVQVLSQILGQDLNGSLAGLIANQKAGQIAAARSGGQDRAKPTAKGARAIKLGGRYATAFQSATNRDSDRQGD